jgi:hypothetical protein
MIDHSTRLDSLDYVDGILIYKYTLVKLEKNDIDYESFNNINGKKFSKMHAMLLIHDRCLMKRIVCLTYIEIAMGVISRGLI